MCLFFGKSLLVSCSGGREPDMSGGLSKTLAPQDESNQKKEEQALADWKKVGGDASEETVVPSALWITAIIE